MKENETLKNDIDLNTQIIEKSLDQKLNILEFKINKISSEYKKENKQLKEEKEILKEEKEILKEEKEILKEENQKLRDTISVNINIEANTTVNGKHIKNVANNSISLKEKFSNSLTFWNKKQKKINFLIKLYLVSHSYKNQNRQQEVAEISRQLKQMAKEFKIPVVALSQLSRNVENREDKRPSLGDLRESGSIEQDADIVLFLYRDDYYKNKSHKKENLGISETELIIAKNRQGELGKVNLIFTLQNASFEEQENEFNIFE